jgi:hypothetical protein
MQGSFRVNDRPFFVYDPDHDINDGKPWSDMDMRDLKAELGRGRPIEEVAAHLCRGGSVNDVIAKARELGLEFTRAAT